MLWKTHLRISNEVLHKLGISLSSPQAKNLKEGVIEPDKWRDYPHHYGKSKRIQECLLSARDAYLQDDLLTAYYNLGVSLHYIQDAYTSLSSKSLKHHSWEEQIEDSKFVQDLSGTIQYFLRKDPSQVRYYSELAKFLSVDLKGRDNTLYAATMVGRAESETWAKPIIDLNFGLRASYIISKSVIGSKHCAELGSGLIRLQAEHERLLQDSELKFSNNIIELIEKRTKLGRTQQQNPIGLVTKFKNFFLGIRLKIANYRVESRYNQYVAKKHLNKVVKKYHTAAGRFASSYHEWYSYQISNLRLNMVKKELLTIKEASKDQSIAVDLLREELDKNNVSALLVKDKELVSRSDLNKILN